MVIRQRLLKSFVLQYVQGIFFLVTTHLHGLYGFPEQQVRANFQEADTIYLRMDELEKLKKLDLSAKPGMERMRDLFLVGCFTGLRFSDFSQIKLSSIV